MTVNFWLLTIALILLWCPRQWLRVRGKALRLPGLSQPKREERGERDVSLNLKEELAKVRNWVDLFRTVGSSLTIGSCFEVLPGAAKTVHMQILALECAIFIIAVLIQTIRFNDGRIVLVPPVFFVLGLSFGLLGWQAASFAFIAVWIVNSVLPSAGFFLSVFAGLELGFGLLLSRTSLGWIILAAFLAILPVILSAMVNRRLGRSNFSNPKKKRSRMARAGHHG